MRKTPKEEIIFHLFSYQICSFVVVGKILKLQPKNVFVVVVVVVEAKMITTLSSQEVRD